MKIILPFDGLITAHYSFNDLRHLPRQMMTNIYILQKQIIKLLPFSFILTVPCWRVPIIAVIIIFLEKIRKKTPLAGFEPGFPAIEKCTSTIDV